MAAGLTLSKAAVTLRLGQRWHQQFVGFNPQRVSEALNVVERNVACLTLHMGDESAVQATLEGQRLLGPAFGVAQDDDVRRQR